MPSQNAAESEQLNAGQCITILTVFIGNISLAKWNVIALVILAYLCDLDGYGVTLYRFAFMDF